MWSNREQSTALSENYRSNIQITKGLDDSSTSWRFKRKQNQMKDTQELIHKIKRYDNSMSLVKLEISEGKYENSKGKDDQILTYEIVSEFMGMRNKLFSVDKGLARYFYKAMSEVLRQDPLKKDTEDITITSDTVNEEVQVQISQESNTYTGIRSAIDFLFCEAGFQISLVISSSLSIYIKGYYIV